MSVPISLRGGGECLKQEVSRGELNVEIIYLLVFFFFFLAAAGTNEKMRSAQGIYSNLILSSGPRFPRRRAQTDNSTTVRSATQENVFSSLELHPAAFCKTPGWGRR